MAKGGPPWDLMWMGDQYFIVEYDDEGNWKTIKDLPKKSTARERVDDFYKGPEQEFSWESLPSDLKNLVLEDLSDNAPAFLYDAEYEDVDYRNSAIRHPIFGNVMHRVLGTYSPATDGVQAIPKGNTVTHELLHRLFGNAPSGSGNTADHEWMDSRLDGRDREAQWMTAEAMRNKQDYFDQISSRAPRYLPPRGSDPIPPGVSPMNSRITGDPGSGTIGGHRPLKSLKELLLEYFNG